MTLSHVNPSTMHQNPYFSQATLVDGGRLLFIGEQNGVDASGEIVAGGAVAQAVQAVEQVKAILAEVGADTSAVAKLTVYFSRDVEVNDIIGPAMQSWGANPTAITVLQIHALGRAGALVGIEAVVSLPPLDVAADHTLPSSVVG
ncbi:RidA family protein [Mycetocola miduiensis]|uniref:2-iminobutanoate/2-iminopropanoate deaminase n=1 Tax=Mycetocola miduiensis TaxID=995034 RepID=A0A1I4YM14_9MICO|nr:RidA family protein [Mycetocola miduiensis]SFN39054.1 2-iminobutanoate/2-iminopropanoate deaminase [Mycetocola miduiensis]